MTFINNLLPLTVSPRASGSLEYMTTVKRLRSGGEFRNRQWQNPLRSFSVRYNARSTSAMMDQIADLAYTTGGAHIGFRARDWSDHQAINEQVAIGDGTTYWFRLTKRYGTYERRILKPDPATVTIKLDDVSLSPDAFAVDGDNGVLVFADPPAFGVRVQWSGEFHVPVRFETDVTEIMMLKHDVSVTDEIGLKEIRLREIIDTDEIDLLRSYLIAFSVTDLEAMLDILDIHVNTNWVNYG